MEILFSDPWPDIGPLHYVKRLIHGYGRALPRHVSGSRQEDGAGRLGNTVLSCAHQHSQGKISPGRVADKNYVPR